MTLDEAIEEIKTNIKVKWMCGDDYSPMMIEALRVLIKYAKLNEKVFEDIKAEIKSYIGHGVFHLVDADTGEGFFLDDDTLIEVLNIIERHIGKEKE